MPNHNLKRDLCLLWADGLNGSWVNEMGWDGLFLRRSVHIADKLHTIRGEIEWVRLNRGLNGDVLQYD